MPELPKSDVIYRIRNVDTRLYLERSLGPSAPQMRSEEVTSKRQHWRLTKFTNGPPAQYRILDPYASTLSALCYNPNPPPSTQSIMVANPDLGASRPNTWTIVANTTNPNENAFYLLPNDPQGGPSVAFGNTIPNNVTPFIGFQMTPSDKDAPTAGGSFQWQISEVSPAALPEETNSKYRIRAFLGKPLQVDASGNLNLDLTDTRGDHRSWTITDKGNGQCTVYSDKAQLFLTAVNVSTTTGIFNWQPGLRSATAPTFIDADRTWTFEKTTSLTHTIFIERPITVQKATGPSTDLCKLSLALDGNNAILKPKKLAHNEVWLVEPIDLPMPNLAGSGNPGVTPGPGAGITPGGTSGLGFPPGLQGNVTYRVRNPESPSVSNPDHIRCYYSGSGYILASGAPAANAAGIRVEPKTNGGVALYCLDPGTRVYLGLSGGAVVTTPLTVSDNAYAWTVTRVSLTDSGGQYTIAAANGQLLSTSSGNNLVLANANNPLSKWQVWNFS